MKRYLIIGNGTADATAVDYIRKHDGKGITVDSQLRIRRPEVFRIRNIPITRGIRRQQV